MTASDFVHVSTKSDQLGAVDGLTTKKGTTDQDPQGLPFFPVLPTMNEGDFPQ
jgi:hypothetical protein